MNLELRAYCEGEDGDLEPCARIDAELYGVYIGDAGDYEWVADFAEYGWALAYCEFLVESCPEEVKFIHDLTELQYCH